MLKLAGWPSTKSAFNVWVNLPTFEPTAGGDVVDRLVQTVRADLEHESERLRDMDFTGFHTIAPWRSPEENAAELARFLDVPDATALTVAKTDHLFSD